MMDLIIEYTPDSTKRIIRNVPSDWPDLLMSGAMAICNQNGWELVCQRKYVWYVIDLTAVENGHIGVIPIKLMREMVVCGELTVARGLYKIYLNNIPIEEFRKS